MQNQEAESEHDLLFMLSHLDKLKDGAHVYFRALADSPDAYVRAGAFMQLLSLKSVTYADWPVLVKLSRHAAIRSLAFEYFESIFEHDLARSVALTEVETREDIRQAALIAQLNLDSEEIARRNGALFLATARASFLMDAAKSAESGGGWKAAFPWLVRALALEPWTPHVVGTIYLLLHQSSQAELCEQLITLLAHHELHAEFTAFAKAGVAGIRNDYARALELLSPLDDASVLANASLAPILPRIRLLRATALDRTGSYRASYEEHAEVNRLERVFEVDPEDYLRDLEIRAKLAVPPLPPDPHDDVLQMIGFPRSGTTLLENALDAHPEIETFEEIPAYQSAVAYVYRVLSKQAPPPPTLEDLYLDARRRFYLELEIRKRKSGSRIQIDKSPLQSGDAALMTKLFPDRRYIFSIRHPFDVALSCFRQSFEPSPSMDNFRTMKDTIRCYDDTMTRWFNYYALSSENVCYVKYEQLVTEFEPTLQRVFAFLGVAWNDSVLGFAAKAEQRGARTPSYQKVRQGLSIGVQTYWRNYGFLFQTPEAEPLHKWARFFGYPTS